MADLRQMDFTDSIADARRGDQMAYAFLYEQTYAYFRSIVVRVIGADSGTDDVMQDVYLKIFEELGSLQDPGAFLKWGATIAQRTAINEYRHRNTGKMTQMEFVSPVKDGEEEPAMDDFAASDYDAQINPEAAMDQAETSRLLNGILDKLPGAQRMCLVLWMQDLSTQEIAAQLDMKVGTVKSNIRYAKGKVEKEVRALAAQGTRLYSMAPLPFFVWLFRQADEANLVSAAGGHHVEMPESLLQMTEDALQMTEDPLRMTEDPLRMTEDPLRMTEDSPRMTEDLLQMTEDPLPAAESTASSDVGTAVQTGSAATSAGAAENGTTSQTAAAAGADAAVKSTAVSGGAAAPAGAAAKSGAAVITKSLLAKVIAAALIVGAAAGGGAAAVSSMNTRSAQQTEAEDTQEMSSAEADTLPAEDTAADPEESVTAADEAAGDDRNDTAEEAAENDADDATEEATVMEEQEDTDTTVIYTDPDELAASLGYTALDPLTYDVSYEIFDEYYVRMNGIEEASGYVASDFADLDDDGADEFYVLSFSSDLISCDSFTEEAIAWISSGLTNSLYRYELSVYEYDAAWNRTDVSYFYTPADFFEQAEKTFYRSGDAFFLYENLVTQSAETVTAFQMIKYENGTLSRVQTGVYPDYSEYGFSDENTGLPIYRMEMEAHYDDPEVCAELEKELEGRDDVTLSISEWNGGLYDTTVSISDSCTKILKVTYTFDGSTVTVVFD